MNHVQEVGFQKTSTKTGIVIFHTQFGNTEKIAKRLTSGLVRAGIAVTCQSTSEVQVDALKDYDLIAVGAPTQAFTASKPMKEFIQKLERTQGLAGKYFYAFDTKLPSRFSGSAAKYIESQLERMGLKAAGPHSSAIGRGGQFKLDEGEEERFEGIGLALGTQLKSTG